MLSQLIYCSEITDLGEQGLPGLLRQCRELNEANGLTGLLLTGGNFFLQCIEGNRLQLTEKFARIAVDPRHTAVTLLSFCDVEERGFSGWTMGYLPPSPQLDEVFNRFLVTVPFTTESLTATSSAAFINTLHSLGGSAYAALAA